jgi:hypothetical protein
LLQVVGFRFQALVACIRLALDAHGPAAADLTPHLPGIVVAVLTDAVVVVIRAVFGVAAGATGA